jgi:hypothetical protein
VQPPARVSVGQRVDVCLNLIGNWRHGGILEATNTEIHYSNGWTPRWVHIANQ